MKTPASPAALIRLRICPNVDSCEPLAGGWHTGWRLPNYETVALCFGGRWYSAPGVSTRPAVIGPFATRAQALAA